MKYSTKVLENKQVEMEIVLTHEEWEEAVAQSYNRNKGKYAVEGFRKGKAPRRVIEKMYGESVFFEDALNESFHNSYQTILSEQPSIEPIDTPTVDVKSMDENGVVLLAAVSVMPEIELGAYKGLKITVEPKVVAEKEVETAISEEQQKHSRLVEVDSAVKNGDIANINFEGSIDGVLFEGGKAENFDLEIGSKSFIDTFEEQLLGQKVNDEKNVIVNFPDQYHEASLAGKEAVFKVKINAVKEKQLPEIDDKFVSDTTEFETVDAYKENLKKQLQRKADDATQRELENKVVDAVVANTKVDVPSVMIDEELDAMFKDLEYRLMYQGLNLEGYAKYLNTTVADLKNKRRNEAKHNVVVKLTLQKILETEKITVTEQDLNDKLETHAKLVDKTVEEYKSSLNENRIINMTNEILTKKLLTFLIENNK